MTKLVSWYLNENFAIGCISQYHLDCIETDGVLLEFTVFFFCKLSF